MITGTYIFKPIKIGDSICAFALCKYAEHNTSKSTNHLCREIAEIHLCQGFFGGISDARALLACYRRDARMGFPFLIIVFYWEFLADIEIIVEAVIVLIDDSHAAIG